MMYVCDAEMRCKCDVFRAINVSVSRMNR